MEYTNKSVDKDTLDYFNDNKLYQYLNERDQQKYNLEYTVHENYHAGIGVWDDAQILPDIYDLVRMHKLVRSRKVFTILEFGTGYSTLILADALNKNKKDYELLNNKPKIRVYKKFEIHSVDADEKWIEWVKNNIKSFPEISDLIHLSYSPIKIGTFNDRMCSYYETIPDIVPDFVYLDAPDTSVCKGDINNLTFNKCKDRTVIAGDLLLMESTFVPGLFILIDGRRNNAIFLKNNFQRNYNINFDNDNDINTFELIDEPLGTLNKNKNLYCLKNE